MRLRRLTLKNWKNFRSVDLPVADRMFVVGPNASGKSNLLDALRFLKEVASPGGGLQAAIERRGGISRIRALSSRNFNKGRVTLGIRCDARDGVVWTYEVTLSRESGGRRRPILVGEVVRRGQDAVLDRPTPADADDPERMTQTHLEQVNANLDFRGVVDFLRSIRYAHLVPQQIRRPGRGASADGPAFDSDGGDLLLRMAKTTPARRATRLRRINAALRAAVPQLDQLDLVQDPQIDDGRWHLRAGYEHWRPRPAHQDESSFSDGTLRLIGMLWSLLEDCPSGGPLLLEKPEISLHAALVRQLPALFHRLGSAAGRQVLVTTHSSELMGDEGIGLDEAVLLEPGSDGAEVRLAADIEEAPALSQAGLDFYEILGSRGAPGVDAFIGAASRAGETRAAPRS